MVGCETFYAREIEAITTTSARRHEIQDSLRKILAKHGTQAGWSGMML